MDEMFKNLSVYKRVKQLFERRTFEVRFSIAHPPLIVYASIGMYPITRRPAISFASYNGEPWGTLTVNMPLEQVPLTNDELLVKTWSENTNWAPMIFAQLNADGEVVRKVRDVPINYVSGEVWEFIPEKGDPKDIAP